MISQASTSSQAAAEEAVDDPTWTNNDKDNADSEQSDKDDDFPP